MHFWDKFGHASMHKNGNRASMKFPGVANLPMHQIIVSSLVTFDHPISSLKFWHGLTVKSILRDHCHKRPPVMKDRIFLAVSPTRQ